MNGIVVPAPKTPSLVAARALPEAPAANRAQGTCERPTRSLSRFDRISMRLYGQVAILSIYK